MLKLETSCTTMDGLRCWQYHHSKNKTIQHLPPISRKTGQCHKLLSKSLLMKTCCVHIIKLDCLFNMCECITDEYMRQLHVSKMLWMEEMK